MEVKEQIEEPMNMNLREAVAWQKGWEKGYKAGREEQENDKK